MAIILSLPLPYCLWIQDEEVHPESVKEQEEAAPQEEKQEPGEKQQEEKVAPTQETTEGVDRKADPQVRAWLSWIPQMPGM